MQMTGVLLPSSCEMAELACAYALHVLPAGEAAAVHAHVAFCVECSDELASLRAVFDRFAVWPVDVQRPLTPLRGRLALRIAEDTAERPVLPLPQRWPEPQWEQVAPGIECKLLATDRRQHRVSMLVRLSPGGRYPAHAHAGAEELHLLHGDLWIDDRHLLAGDSSFGAPGTVDHQVWSETGCTCVLVTSSRDSLR
jgi:anti-sigma factor ChrR (cupin superfamily)